jgi:hypothetical protein
MAQLVPLLTVTQIRMSASGRLHVRDVIPCHSRSAKLPRVYKYHSIRVLP